MSWLLNLFETYEANSNQIGIVSTRYNNQEYTLLPISHTTQNAQVEVQISEDGQFLSAFVISKDIANTLIPCTEDSASRAGSKIAPYPLHDKLIYVAGDYVTYAKDKTSGDHFEHYIKQLGEWANSPYSTNKVKSIYSYLSKRTLISDLVSHNILAVDREHKLITKWDKKYEQQFEEKPAIFSVLAGDQESVFVRFNVYGSAASLSMEPVWKDAQMYQSFVQYYNDKLAEADICYVTGKIQPITDKHANKIRNSGDKAKLISSNDSSGFTYRGRFEKSRDVASISYEASQKAHNALKWLINRQGKTIDNRVFLIWGNNHLDIPDIATDSFNIIQSLNITETENEAENSLLAFFSGQAVDEKEEQTVFTYEDYADEFKKAVNGYYNKLIEKSENYDSNINIMVVDSATTGRMAVLYYRNLEPKHYFQKLIDWHTTCTWRHRYTKNSEGRYINVTGAPSTRDIAFAAYGSVANEKVIKGLMERMLPCLIDGAAIPADIVRSAIERSSSPEKMEAWEWEKTLSISCALLKLFLLRTEKEEYNVALDLEQNDRDYLFGRLLALADILERRALRESNEKRATNAIRYMNSFARYPERTWKTIQASLQPYQAKLGVRATDISKAIDEVASRIPFEQFNNTPLSGKYLLGFYSQRHAYYNDNSEQNRAEIDEENK